MEVIWRDVRHFEGFYQVSNFGRVKSLARDTVVHGVKRRNRKDGSRKDEVWHRKEKLLSYIFYGDCIPYVRLYKDDNGSRVSVPVKVLVAQAFLDAPDDIKTNHIKHKDKIAQNCRADNLYIK